MEPFRRPTPADFLRESAACRSEDPDSGRGHLRIDTETELLLQKGLQELLKGRTSFVIAHRLSTIKNSSCILYVDQGSILEQGTHDELMEKRGWYYELYKSQYMF